MNDIIDIIEYYFYLDAYKQKIKEVNREYKKNFTTRTLLSGFTCLIYNKNPINYRTMTSRYMNMYQFIYSFIINENNKLQREAVSVLSKKY